MVVLNAELAADEKRPELLALDGFDVHGLQSPDRTTWGIDRALAIHLKDSFYSPDSNPIEQAFAKLKVLLRKAAARTLVALEHAIAQALEAFTPAECANYFTNSGYEPD